MPLCSRLYAMVLALFLCIIFSANAQDDQLKTASRQELDITKVLLAQEDAWNKGDLEGFIQGYKNSPDTLFVTHQIYRGRSGG